MDKEQIQGMLKGCRFPGNCDDPQLIETHISWIVLAGGYAYKIKRPVTYSFLDFSTLKKREHFCERELELNRRLAEGMYLELFPITAGMVRGGNQHDDGEILDYAVKMKRMDNSREMDQLLRQGKVEHSRLEKLAEKIAAFHKNARVIKNAFDTTGFQEKFADLLSVQDFIVEKTGPAWRDRIRDCVNRSNAYLNSQRSYFNERIISSFRRDGHGDLNASNIFLYEDPVIFDCIEFNDEYRHIDVLNDIAFLCVDLDFYGDPGMSDHFYSRYLNAFGLEDDDASRKLFLYYKSFRANVRAKVTALSAQEKEDDEQEIKDMKKYVSLLEAYCQDY